jgi:PLAT/LH2 domain
MQAPPRPIYQLENLSSSSTELATSTAVVVQDDTAAAEQQLHCSLLNAVPAGGFINETPASCTACGHGSAPQPVQYQIQLTTGNKRGMGVDGSVFIDIHGNNDSTGWLELDKVDTSGTLRFQRGAMDSITLAACDVGTMTHVLVGYASSSSTTAAGWFLAAMRVQHLGSGQVLELGAGCWLRARQPDGGSTDTTTTTVALWPPANQGGSHPSNATCTGAAPLGEVAWDLAITTGEL